MTNTFNNDEALYSRWAPNLAKLSLFGYEDYAMGFTRLVETKQPDLFICDFFSDACHDVAAHNNIKIAIAGSAGFMGVFAQWYSKLNWLMQQFQIILHLRIKIYLKNNGSLIGSLDLDLIMLLRDGCLI
jgi:hypothetical protein